MNKTIALSVTNDTYTDQRVHKIARKLFYMGYRVIIIGKKSKQKIESPNYAKIVRFRMLFKKSAGFYAEYNLKLFFYLLFSKINILTANDLDTLPANYLVSVIRRKRLVYDSHEFFTESPEIVNRKSLQNFWRKIEKICIKRIDVGITVSQPIADYYENQYNKSFYVVRNLPENISVNHREIDFPDFFNHPGIVVYQGSLNIGRGLEMAIDSFKFIENARLIIIGSGDIENELKERVKEKELEKKVFFLGRISPEILPAYTAKAKIGLSIEENLGKNYEYALPNKLFDYIHAEVPVIVSDLPEMSKIVLKYDVGKILKTSNSKDKSVNSALKSEMLASLINEILLSPDLYNKYKQNCRNAANELCWEKESLLIEEIYNKQ